MVLLTSIFLYAIVFHVVHALPLEKRIVIDPPITSPSAGTVWTPGMTELVTWDPSVVPPTGDFPGTILLGHLTPGSENLDIGHPLASGFSLRDGSVEVTCPTVSPGDTYIIVLMGDSGNVSPQFTISGPYAGSASSASPNDQPTPSLTKPGTATTQQAPAASTTPASSSPTQPAPSSDSSAPSWTLAVTTSSSVTTPPPAPSPSAFPTSSTSSSGSSTSTTSSGSNSPAFGLNANNAIAQSWNAGTIVTCAVVTVFTMFFL